MARRVSSRNLAHDVNCANGPLIGRFTSSCRRKRPKSRLIFCRRRPVASLAVRSAFSRMPFGSARRSASRGVGRCSGVRLSGFPTAVRMAVSSRISHASVMRTGTTPTQCGGSATFPTVFAISWILASPRALSVSLCTKSRPPQLVLNRHPAALWGQQIGLQRDVRNAWIFRAAPPST